MMLLLLVLFLVGVVVLVVVVVVVRLKLTLLRLVVAIGRGEQRRCIAERRVARVAVWSNRSRSSGRSRCAKRQRTTRFGKRRGL